MNSISRVMLKAMTSLFFSVYLKSGKVALSSLLLLSLVFLRETFICNNLEWGNVFVLIRKKCFYEVRVGVGNDPVYV